MTPNILTQRAAILRGIREFFWARGFLEVETPVLLAHPSLEPYLEPFRTTLHDHRGTAHDGFLRMSPEFSIKKILGSISGLTSHVSGLFEMGPVFRDAEPWGGSHNPEFSMLEWYRLGATYQDLMDDCEQLTFACLSLSILEGEIKRGWRAPAEQQASTTRNENTNNHIAYQNQTIDCSLPWERLTMRDAWQYYAQLDLDALLTHDAMAHACTARGLTVADSDMWDDLFFKIHLTDVEPRIGRERPTFLLDWPVQLAALARKKPDDPRYAERVELYIGGLEIANGFSELTDSREQRARFEEDQELRRRLGKPAYPNDEEFLVALDRMPPTAGIALGVDRLVMLLLDAPRIEDVRWLTAPALFERGTENGNSHTERRTADRIE